MNSKTWLPSWASDRAHVTGRVVDCREANIGEKRALGPQSYPHLADTTMGVVAAVRSRDHPYHFGEIGDATADTTLRIREFTRRETCIRQDATV